MRRPDASILNTGDDGGERSMRNRKARVRVATRDNSPLIVMAAAALVVLAALASMLAG